MGTLPSGGENDRHAFIIKLKLYHVATLYADAGAIRQETGLATTRAPASWRGWSAVGAAAVAS